MGNLCNCTPAILVTPNTINIPEELEPLTSNVKSFTIKKSLGKGSIGRVWLVSKKSTGDLYAMKTINKSILTDANGKTQIAAELSSLARIHSRFVVKMHYAFQTPQKLFMVLDFMQGGDLLYHLRTRGKFDVPMAQFYAAEVLLGLEDLHMNGTIHRDLKLENVLVGIEGHVKLSDFSVTKIISSELKRTRTICGTPEYLAPEVLNQEEETEKLDYWAFGVLVYEMLVGYTPFYNKSLEKVIENILSFRCRIGNELEKSARELVEGLLKFSSGERFASIEDIKNCPFFKGVNWREIREKRGRPPMIPVISSELDVSCFSSQM